MPSDDGEQAPGGPGVEARWTSSAKSGVGTAIGGRVWFTLSHGILNEVYYPRVDQACVRDLGLVVTDHAGRFFSEEKRHASHQVAGLADGVPAYRLTNTCDAERYRIDKEVVADPRREVVLQRITFTALQGATADYALYALMAPHLGNAGADNTGWVGDYKGRQFLFAERHGVALALACSSGWRARSVGFVGSSDGWQQLRQHGALTPQYQRAAHGNIALTGQLDLTVGEPVELALGFGRTWAEAAHRASASLIDGFDVAAAAYRQGWGQWQAGLRPPPPALPRTHALYRASTAVVRTHESARFPGALVASLSVPWGASKGDGDLGGYHLVWPRDLVESAGGLLAIGADDEVRRVLTYLAVTQEADGHWPQNMWIDGTPYWHGIQMDETGFPILLVDLARRRGVLDNAALAQLWPMVRRAAQFIITNGPVTQQDRWEEDPGYSPFTLAVEIAALLAAADLARVLEPRLVDDLHATADAWNDAIERWTYVTGTELAGQVGVDGYYVRVAAPDGADAASPQGGFVPIKNRPPGEDCAAAAHLVSPDALALVRFGLRAADDPRVVATAAVIDALLVVELPAGPVWKRYNGDGYGEHRDGAPFDGTGVGHPWPLLTAERAHFELAAGRGDRAAALADTLVQLAGDACLLPEQVWDDDDLPHHELRRGGPTGSAMPLVWAHAEFLKLCRSLADGRVFDLPPQPVARYQIDRVEAAHVAWRKNNKCAAVPAGKALRIELTAAATVHWSVDGWHATIDSPTRDTGLGLHVVELAPGPAARLLDFTIYWTDAARWEGRDFAVELAPSPAAPAQGAT